MLSLPENLRLRARQIRLAIFDVDGVLTDGRLYYTAEGETLKAFHVHDGHGLVLLRDHKIRTAIISGRASAALDRRLAELRFDYVYTDCGADKTSAFADLCRQAQVAQEECSMMGDDLPDLPIINRCGLSFAPPQAVRAVRDCVDYVTQAYAGKGAVREACDFIVEAKNF